MKLYLYKSKYIDNDFVTWLLPNIFPYIFRQVNVKILRLSNRIFEENDIPADARAVILAGIRCLHIVETKEMFIIEIHPRVFYRGTKRTVKSLCSILEYGTLSIPGTHIFSNAFNEIERDIIPLYVSYLRELI